MPDLVQAVGRALRMQPGEGNMQPLFRLVQQPFFVSSPSPKTFTEHKKHFSNRATRGDPGGELAQETPPVQRLVIPAQPVRPDRGRVQLGVGCVQMRGDVGKAGRARLVHRFNGWAWTGDLRVPMLTATTRSVVPGRPLRPCSAHPRQRSQQSMTQSKMIPPVVDVRWSLRCPTMHRCATCSPTVSGASRPLSGTRTKPA
jgi:hypothetical protein